MINIALATDDNYVQHCCVVIASILQHNRDVHFYILTEALTDANSTILKQQASGEILEIVYVPSDTVHKFPMPSKASSHISIATYYRLYIPTLLPFSVSKVLYLDCDMVIEGDLTPLYNISLDGFALAAVYQNNEWADSNNSWQRLNIPRKYGYFNAGMLVINVAYLRNINFVNKAFNYIKENYEYIVSHDQDVLNSLLYNKVFPVSCKYNALPLFYEKKFDKYTFPEFVDYQTEFTKGIMQTPTVIHYVNKPKPWEYGCVNPYKKEYYKYLLLTPWRDFKPKVTKKYIKNTIVKLLLSLDFLKLRKLNKIIRTYIKKVYEA